MRRETKQQRKKDIKENRKDEGIALHKILLTLKDEILFYNEFDNP